MDDLSLTEDERYESTRLDEEQGKNSIYKHYTTTRLFMRNIELFFPSERKLLQGILSGNN